MTPFPRTAASQGLIAILSAAWLAAVLVASADTLSRSYFDTTPVLTHLRLAVGLLVAPAAVLGVIGAAGIWGVAQIRQRWGRWRTFGLTAVLFGAAATYFACAPLKTTLSGVFSRSPEYARWILLGALLLLGVCATIGVFVLAWAADVVHRGRLRPATLLGSGLVLLGGVLMAADLNVLVALYASFHLLVEVSAWLCAFAGASLLLYAAQQRLPRLMYALSFLTVGALAWVLYFGASNAARARSAEALHHVWREPLYAGRMTLRMQLLADYLQNPGAWQGALDSRISRLERRYDISTTSLSTRWDLPREHTLAEPVRAPMNVLVVFVDTLRADTAADARWMPNLAELSKNSLVFKNAFSAASDTVSTLPVLTGGCYGRVPCADDSLRLMRERGVKTGVFLARSAHRFLKKLSPHFDFEHVQDVPDYAEDKEVWGYGADGPTAQEVVRNTLGWIDAQQGQQFFAWSFHFDVHNWMHLDEAYLQKIAGEVGLDASNEENSWRYKSAAVGVDRALGELMAGLQARKLEQNTALLFVSDHGEALGQRSHAYHSVYLWDSLIRVPLVLRVPGVAAQEVTDAVGHVDVAPTVLSLLFPGEQVASSHGVSLLNQKARADALPLLLLSMRKEELLRVGLINRQAPLFKLELPLESTEPELFELAGAADERDVSREHRARMLSMLSQLVTSPVFPRSKETPEQPKQTKLELNEPL